MVESLIKLVPIKCSQMSLIGTGSDLPVQWGNYFWIDDIRVVNIWWENLNGLSDKLGGNVTLRVYECHLAKSRPMYNTPSSSTPRKYGIVEDVRVPKEYLYNKLCFTGTYTPSIEIAVDMYVKLGVMTEYGDELEQWTDPITYWSKRGAIYNPRTGIIIHPGDAGLIKKIAKPEIEPIKLANTNVSYVGEQGAFYCPYVPASFMGEKQK